jgi:hypothetical protein
MNYYAGLDVSLEETAICVIDASGRIVREMRAASEPEALIAALQALGVPLERIGIEACSLTAWLHDELCAAGLPAVCIETPQANATMRTMPNKTDRNDARALAQIMRTGWFRQVHVKSRQARLWRPLLVARRTVLNEMRTIENVVRYQSGETELAAWFAWRFVPYRKHLPIVASTKIPRTSILFFDDGRGEKEVIPQDRPVRTPVVFWEDQGEIRAAYERVRDCMDRNRRQMFERGAQVREGEREPEVGRVRKQLISLLRRYADKGTVEAPLR